MQQSGRKIDTGTWWRLLNIMCFVIYSFFVCDHVIPGNSYEIFKWKSTGTWSYLNYIWIPSRDNGLHCIDPLITNANKWINQWTNGKRTLWYKLLYESVKQCFGYYVHDIFVYESVLIPFMIKYSCVSTSTLYEHSCWMCVRKNQIHTWICHIESAVFEYAYTVFDIYTYDWHLLGS